MHLAGKAHQMQPINASIYFEINYQLTKELASQAKEKGVSHFIFISTVKVYGDSLQDRTLNERSICNPTDAYGQSKFQAERALLDLEDSKFTVSIIRPPLVYGKRVKGNMLKLLQLPNNMFSVPFKSINNLRSIVYVDNLISLIEHLIQSPTSGIFIAGDKHPVSTSFIIEQIYKSYGKRLNWFSIPSFFRKIIRQIRPDLYQRLFGSFVIDTNTTNNKLNFNPPYSTEYGIQEMVVWHQNEQKIR